MAEAVTQVFAPKPAKGSPNLLLAEAGTGIGKTLAYLAPASLWAEQSGGTVWVSTFTKALQRQLDARRAQAVRRRGGARAADRRPQGPRKLFVPAQSRGRAAGRVRRTRGGAGAAGRPLGRLQQGRRHGRRRPAGLAAEPVPPRRRGRADRPARRMRLCRLPALPPLLHRARRAGQPRGGHRHRQPCAGDDQCGARARRRAGADPVRRGPSSVRRRRIRPSRWRSAGRKRSSSALDRRAGRPFARTAARACGAADGCRLL